MGIGLTSCSEAQTVVDEKKVSKQQFVYENLDVDAFKEMLEDGRGTILDVRTKKEVNNGTISGAVHIDYFSSDFIEEVSHLDKSKPVYIYCASGGRSGGAMEKMKNLGFTEIYNLNGGMGAWESSGYPIVK